MIVCLGSETTAMPEERLEKVKLAPWFPEGQRDIRTLPQPSDNEAYRVSHVEHGTCRTGPCFTSLSPLASLSCIYTVGPWPLFFFGTMPGIAVCPDVRSSGRLYLVRGAVNQGNAWGNEPQDTYQGFTWTTALLWGTFLRCSLSVQESPTGWSIAALFHPLGKQILTVRKQIKKEYLFRCAAYPLWQWRPIVPHIKWGSSENSLQSILFHGRDARLVLRVLALVVIYKLLMLREKKKKRIKSKPSQMLHCSISEIKHWFFKAMFGFVNFFKVIILLKFTNI